MQFLPDGSLCWIRPGVDLRNYRVAQSDERYGGARVSELLGIDVPDSTDDSDTERVEKEKNVKNVFVTKGNAEDYDIEKVVQELEASTTEKSKRKRKKKSKKKKNRIINPDNTNVEKGIKGAPEASEAAVVTDAIEAITARETIGASEASRTVKKDGTFNTVEVIEPEVAEATLVLVSEKTKDDHAQINEEPKSILNPDQQLEPKSQEIPECSTCFEPRTQTFLLVPCGHATFCQNCAIQFCTTEPKKCPTCRGQVTGKIRVFQ